VRYGRVTLYYIIKIIFMSSNNSPEIVTQKELEPVLQNKAFDAKKFLELYEEWKQTHDTHTFALLR